MRWNWQKPNWPHFTWDLEKMRLLEERFSYSTGVFAGTLKHLSEDDKMSFIIEIISTEAVKTSQIEGEILNRDSVQSSLLRKFGLQSDNRRVSPAENGISEMMGHAYNTFSNALTHDMMHHWHRLIIAARTDISEIGMYRTDEEPMQVVSGAIYAPKVHFEAPPSKQVVQEMSRFIEWFNHTAPQGDNALPPLTRAALTHLYFVSIHPYEDGNGRIARALCEKSLSQAVGYPLLIALSHVIDSAKGAYYRALEQNNQSMDVTDWVTYFGETTLEALAYAQRLTDFTVEKTKFYEKFHARLNDRQAKVLSRLFREGPEGFKGGLSVENYLKINQTSRASATRDLKGLVNMGALRVTGKLKSTRYWLNMS